MAAHGRDGFLNGLSEAGKSTGCRLLNDAGVHDQDVEQAADDNEKERLERKFKEEPYARPGLAGMKVGRTAMPPCSNGWVWEPDGRRSRPPFCVPTLPPRLRAGASAIANGSCMTASDTLVSVECQS